VIISFVWRLGSMLSMRTNASFSTIKNLEVKYVSSGSLNLELCLHHESLTCYLSKGFSNNTHYI
jgi:hypothetical protein